VINVLEISIHVTIAKLTVSLICHLVNATNLQMNTPLQNSTLIGNPSQSLIQTSDITQDSHQALLRMVAKTSKCVKTLLLIQHGVTLDKQLYEITSCLELKV